MYTAGPPSGAPCPHSRYVPQQPQPLPTACKYTFHTITQACQLSTPQSRLLQHTPTSPCSHHIPVCVAAPEEPEEACGEAPTATAAPNSPSSPLPSPVPPPFTFLKCSEGVEISCLSQLSLACAPRRFQLARNVSASALCSIVPACLFPQTSIVHYSR